MPNKSLTAKQSIAEMTKIPEQDIENIPYSSKTLLQTIFMHEFCHTQQLKEHQQSGKNRHNHKAAGIGKESSLLREIYADSCHINKIKKTLHTTIISVY